MRVWVTRAEPAATRTAARLQALGHDPLVAPATTIVRTSEPRPDGHYDGILLTSRNGVSALSEDATQGAVVFAVGERTADEAHRAGLHPVIAADGDAASLAALIARTLPAGSALLHIAGEDRKAEPAASLREAGYALTVWTAYSARPVESLPPGVAAALLAERAERLDAVLHYSRRSAAIALALAQAASLGETFGRLKHLCLSDDAAIPLVEAGIPAHFVPARPSEEALLSGLGDGR